MSLTTYRIRRWNEVFENSQSRQYQRLTWTPLPNKHDGKSYRRLISMADGPALYGAWVLLVQVASKCPQRGVLADDDGPLDAEDLSHKTGAPAELFAKAFEVLCTLGNCPCSSAESEEGFCEVEVFLGFGGRGWS